MRWSRLTWFAVLLPALACGAGSASSGGAPTTCQVYASTFNGFRGWSTAAATAANDASDGLHGVGPLEVYWSQSPPHDSATFPICTIIVKETEEADLTKRTVFAMAKVGGDFNATG